MCIEIFTLGRKEEEERKKERHSKNVYECICVKPVSNRMNTCMYGHCVSLCVLAIAMQCNKEKKNHRRRRREQQQTQKYVFVIPRKMNVIFFSCVERKTDSHKDLRPLKLMEQGKNTNSKRPTPATAAIFITLIDSSHIEMRTNLRASNIFRKEKEV